MRFVDWGLIDYELALQNQLSLVEEVVKDPAQETIIFCSHPPVVTLGKKSLSTDIIGWNGKIVPVQRGGRATYHGPGQLVIYPILHLGLRNKDLYLYLRKLEESVVNALKSLGIAAKGNEDKIREKESEDSENLEGMKGDRSGTGVWVEGERKIASIGIAVKRWVSYHGVAINIGKDPLAFYGISPCGYTPQTMTCLQEMLGDQVNRPTFRSEFQQSLQFNLQKTVGI